MNIEPIQLPTIFEKGDLERYYDTLSELRDFSLPEEAQLTFQRIISTIYVIKGLQERASVVYIDLLREYNRVSRMVRNWSRLRELERYRLLVQDPVIKMLLGFQNKEAQISITLRDFDKLNAELGDYVQELKVLCDLYDDRKKELKAFMSDLRLMERTLSDSRSMGGCSPLPLSRGREVSVRNAEEIVTTDE